MKTIKRIGVLAHPQRPESFTVAHSVAALVAQAELAVWYQEVWSEEALQSALAETDLIIAIGGDGAMLRAARLCAPFRLPILGLNMGYLGFLTETSPDAAEEALARILAGDYWIEERLMIRGEVYRNGVCILQEDALNDVVISRGAIARTVHLQANIDGEWATNYSADGLIIATPTGSTAYALACGGPILPPDLVNIVMVPVAPHFSMERPIILSQGASVQVIVSERNRAETEIVCTIDGNRNQTLQIGDEVQVKASENRSYFIRLQGRNYFFRSLMDRMEPRFLSTQPPERNH